MKTLTNLLCLTAIATIVWIIGVDQYRKTFGHEEKTMSILDGSFADAEIVRTLLEPDTLERPQLKRSPMLGASAAGSDTESYAINRWYTLLEEARNVNAERQDDQASINQARRMRQAEANRNTNNNSRINRRTQTRGIAGEFRNAGREVTRNSVFERSKKFRSTGSTYGSRYRRYFLYPRNSRPIIRLNR